MACSLIQFFSPQAAKLRPGDEIRFEQDPELASGILFVPKRPKARSDWPSQHFGATGLHLERRRRRGLPTD